ncbi:hypothetical protein [Thioclava sp.]|uniref:hypothetical protein n=1 Tax=Thioclava sp. TaxID=1933450 RepID=UPI003AA992F0
MPDLQVPSRDLASLTLAHRKLDEVLKTGGTIQETIDVIRGLILDQMMHPEGEPADLAQVLGELIATLTRTIGEMRDTANSHANEIKALRSQIDAMATEQKTRDAQISRQLSLLLDALGLQLPVPSES